MCVQQYNKIQQIFCCIGPIQQPMQYSNTAAPKTRKGDAQGGFYADLWC
jgi:hypothetical protein